MAITFNRRTIALGLGLVYTAIGAIALVPGAGIAGQLGPFGPLASGATLGALHLAIGLIAIWASRAPGQARPALTGLTAAFVLLVGASFVAPLATTLALGGAATLLHAASLLLAGYGGLVEPERATA